MNTRYDLAVVGAGIVGLAHAWAAARLGKKVVVIERDARAVGASIRNFGFVTVTGQQRGAMWRRALTSSRRWRQVAGEAGIALLHDGLLMCARRPEALDVLEAFRATEMGEDCRLLSPAAVHADHPHITGVAAGALWSPHETRVESRDAIRRLAAWLEERWGVRFLWSMAVLAADPPAIRTARGTVHAEAAILCPGDDHVSLHPERLSGLRRTRLQMLRLADPGFRLSCGVMSDLGLARYAGYAALPEAAALRARLAAEQPRHLAHGVHLIAVQSEDGSLVVGDSHHDAETPLPFASSAVDVLILDEYAQVLSAPPPVVERWTGTYSVSVSGAPVLVERISDAVRLVVVTTGAGASTAFALAEAVVGDLYGHADWKETIP